MQNYDKNFKAYSFIYIITYKKQKTVSHSIEFWHVFSRVFCSKIYFFFQIYDDNRGCAPLEDKNRKKNSNSRH